MGDDLIAELDIRLMMAKAGSADKISFTPAEVCEIRASLGGYRAALASRPAAAKAWIAAQPGWFNHSDQYQAREHMWPSPNPQDER